MPDTLPPHEILELMGRDAAGRRACYRALDPARGLVTLQVIAPGFFESPDTAALFLRDVRAFAQLRLPYVLPVYEAGRYDGGLAFTTKFTPKESLSDRRAQFTDPPAAANLVEKLARGMAAAHAHGLLHGDLYPGNILFDENDQPMVGGFDMTRFSNSVQPGCVAAWGGRPAYMPPERFASPTAFDVSTDVWALGVISYELLAGRLPFDGSMPEVIHRVLSAEPIPPRRLRRDIDPVLEAVVLHCLEKRPLDRYPSARALADDLERWRLGQPTVVRPPTWTQRVLRALRRKTP